MSSTWLIACFLTEIDEDRLPNQLYKVIKIIMFSFFMKTMIYLFVLSLHYWNTVYYFLQAALLNSPRQRRKGQKGTPTMKGSVSNQSC